MNLGFRFARRYNAFAGFINPPLREPDELHIIILQPFRIALFHRGEIFTNIFGFDMAEGNFSFCEDEIGSTAKNPRWFVRGDDSLTD
jgi:hypothetical protein